MTNWAVLTIHYAALADGLKLTLTTDAPVHLFMRYTTTPPQKHVLPRTERGAGLGHYLDQCFVAYHENEQEEAGDTTTHTFIKHNWAVCVTRWFLFHGTREGTPTPSASPIFTKHRTEPSPPIELCHTIGGDEQYVGKYNCTEAAAGFQPVKTFQAVSVDIRYATQLAVRQCYNGNLRFYYADPQAEPGALFAGPYPFTHPPMGDYEFKTHNILLPTLQFNAGTRYSIAISWTDTTPGPTTRRMRWIRPSNASCPITPAPTTHFWSRFKSHLSDPPCQGDWSAWAPYHLAVHHYHKFYGYEL
jgi:hypothetical protein